MHNFRQHPQFIQYSQSKPPEPPRQHCYYQHSQPINTFPNVFPQRPNYPTENNIEQDLEDYTQGTDLDNNAEKYCVVHFYTLAEGVMISVKSLQRPTP